MVDFERLVPRRNAAPEAMNGAPALQSVVSMAELIRRPSRPPDHAAENCALIALVQEMAVSPEGILQKLADTALALCRAHSAGLSLLEEGDQERSFHWRAIAGQWAPHVNGGTPRDFGPCGTVLDRNSALLFSHPERDFPYFGDVQPLLDEGLLIPFYIKGQAVGTIWVVAHDESRRFDTEDLRVMTNLGTFAAAAYQTWLSLNATQRNASIVDSSDDAIIGKNLDGIITSWNKGAERVFGYAAEEVIGKPVTILIPPGCQEEEAAIIDRIRHGQRVEHFETVRLGKHGNLIEISLTVSPVKNAQGTIIGASKIARDITERKRAEETSRRAEQELRDFLENASVGMHWVGPDGIILWANRTELDMLGFTREEYIGRHIAEFHADQPVIEDILHRLSSRDTLSNYEARLRCKDNSIRHVLINSNVLWDGDKFVHTRCFTRDITERKRSEAQIAILAREAEHRAKNVLATVQATVHLTQSDTPEGLKHAIEGRIQALANVHSLFVESRWTGAELRSLVTQELSPYCQGGEARVRIDGPDLLLEPNTAQTIAVTLHELATNAAKYGALSVPNGRVQIEWSRAADGRLVLRWTETGGPLVKPPTRQGFGTRVMERMIRSLLNGELRFDWRAEGLTCEIALLVEN